MNDDHLPTEPGTSPDLDATVPPEAVEREIRTIGPYRLLDLIGEGGMGEVWRAEQTAPIRRIVAVKLIKAGMDSREVVNRFEAERQALAMMDHPCIARVLDAGTTSEGRPYFVMEYVAGLPINTYCDRNRLRTRERLQLFRRVCQGVQHAHQKAVLHRDLKPGNVLVTDQDGKHEPKIIDFGVAKALASPLTDSDMHTTLGQIIGTPEYMSPEQAEQSGVDVDTRADVYSLGVILYELLAGALPFESSELRAAGFEGIRRRLQEEEPAKPSSRFSTLGDRSTSIAESRRTNPRRLRSRLTGDLDWIVMRALEKDRNRRYGSPQEFAEDIRRHMHSKPVTAGPPSPAYRVGKFVGRHRTGVVVTAAAVVLLLGFAITSTFQARSIARERDRAEFEAAKSGAINEFLKTMLTSADPWTSGEHDLTIAEALDGAVEDVGESFGDQPLLEAEMRAVIGNTYLGLGKLPVAEEQVRQALDMRLAMLGPDHPDLAADWLALADIRRKNQEFDASVEAAREAVRIQSLQFDGSHPDRLDGMEVLANCLVAARVFDEAGAVLDEYDRMALSLPEAARTRLGGVAIIRADLIAEDTEDLDAVDSLLTLAIDHMHRYDPDSPDLPLALNDHAVNHMLMGDLDEARAIYEESLEAHRKTFGEDHPEYAATLENLGGVAYRQHYYDEALSLLAQVRDIRERNLGPDHIDVARTMANMGVIATSSGKFDEALVIFEVTTPRIIALHGEDHPETATLLRNQGIAQRGLERYAEADANFRRVIGIYTRLYGPEHAQVGKTRYQIAMTLMKQQRWREAEPEMQHAFVIMQASYGDDHGWTERTAAAMVEVCEALGKPDDAAPYREYQR